MCRSCYAGPAAIVAAVVGEDIALGTGLADAGYWSRQCRHRDGGPPFAGRRPRGTPAARLPARSATATQPDTEGLDATLTPTHGPQAANQTQSRPVSVARPDGRAGVRTREGAAGRRPLHDARPRSLPRRVETALPLPATSEMSSEDGKHGETGDQVAPGQAHPPDPQQPTAAIISRRLSQKFFICSSGTAQT